MKLNSETQKKIASEWFKYLQLEMCKEFESLEKMTSEQYNIVSEKFSFKEIEELNSSVEKLTNYTKDLKKILDKAADFKLELYRKRNKNKT